jgi:IS1 family transposase
VDSKKVSTQPAVAETLSPARPDDVLEVDEVCSFVRRKSNKRWTWVALCRRTRQVVACVVGDRGEATCRRLWEAIPPAYRACTSYSDFWAAYATVFPSDTHHSVDKKSGGLAHGERWHNTLRQRLARYVRKTLSFSKSEHMHERVTLWYVVTYNLEILPSVIG